MGINYIKYAKINTFNQNRPPKKAVCYISASKAVAWHKPVICLSPQSIMSVPQGSFKTATLSPPLGVPVPAPLGCRGRISKQHLSHSPLLETLACGYLLHVAFCFHMTFPGGSDGEESVCKAGDPGSIPGLGRSPGEGNINPLQHSCLEDSMDRGA